jgi:hypothetical protein
MSDQEKQNIADTWIFETAVLTVLRTAGQNGDASAAQQATQLAQLLMQRLNAL